MLLTGDDCVAVEMDKIEMEAREVCSFADSHDIMKSELDDKRQEVGDLEEDVKELRKKVEWLEGRVRVQVKGRAYDTRNSGTQREGFMGTQWWDVACQAIPVGVDKSVGAVAPVVDRKPRDVVVQVAVPLLVSTSSMQTYGQVEAVAIPKPSYGSVATQATLVPAGARKGTSGGPVPLGGGAGPQPVGVWTLVVHGVPTIAKKKFPSGRRGMYHVVLCVLCVPNAHS